MYNIVIQNLYRLYSFKVIIKISYIPCAVQYILIAYLFYT